jgi:hypothetical protein
MKYLLILSISIMQVNHLLANDIFRDNTKSAANSKDGPYYYACALGYNARKSRKDPVSQDIIYTLSNITFPATSKLPDKFKYLTTPLAAVAIQAYITPTMGDFFDDSGAANNCSKLGAGKTSN